MNGIFNFPGRCLHFFARTAHHNFDILAAEAPGGAAAIHRCVAATKHDDFFADFGGVFKRYTREVFNADLDIGVEVVGVPTVREADGLALSSRNAYLTAEERAAAEALPKAIALAKAELEAGGAVSDALEAVRRALVAAGFQSPDYVALCGAEDLQDMAVLDRPARLFVAARLGKARLIDNWGVDPQ